MGLPPEASNYLITKPKIYHFVQLGVCLWGVRCTNMGSLPQDAEFVSKIPATYRLKALNNLSFQASEMA